MEQQPVPMEVLMPLPLQEEGRENLPQQSVLLLGMFYSQGVYLQPNRGQGFRDAVRCSALEVLGYEVKSLDDKHTEEEYYDGELPGKHCTANFADARRMSQSLRNSITFLREFDHIILDYFFSPAGWARTRWTDNFFKDTIPRLAEDELIRRGGQFWLPNLECVAQALREFRIPIETHYEVEFVKDLGRNPLFAATERVEDELLRCPDKLTNETQLRPLLAFSDTPFLVLTRRQTPLLFVPPLADGEMSRSPKKRKATVTPEKKRKSSSGSVSRSPARRGSKASAGACADAGAGAGAVDSAQPGEDTDLLIASSVRNDIMSSGEVLGSSASSASADSASSAGSAGSGSEPLTNEEAPVTRHEGDVSASVSASVSVSVSVSAT